MSALWSPRTVTELLRYRAEHDPDRIAYRFLDYEADGDPAVSEISYGDLERQARAVAVALSEAGSLGDRVLILCSPGLPYIVHFYGCLYAGMVAVLASPPGPSGGFERIDAIARNCGATVVLSDTADTARQLAEMAAGCDSVLVGTCWLSAEDTVRTDGGADWAAPDTDAETLAYLQYTSGSTALPKGVMITHANVLANTRAVRELCGIGPDDPVVNWAPVYHNAGLVGCVLTPLYTGCTGVHMAPSSFIRSPQRWLEAISRYGGVVSTAPDFAYRMAAARVSEEAKQGLDLSSWRVAIDGAEPVHAEVFDAFAAAFASCGFDPASLTPVYGLAECVLFVAGKPARTAPVVRQVSGAALEQARLLPPADAADARPLVSCGTAGHGIEIRIVDQATGGEASPGALGEIWVGGPSIASGYFGAPEATNAAFQRADGGSGQRYLHTGDIGALVDGELYVTGRADDLMIFTGRNIYPQDIEETAGRSDPAVANSRCAAFSVDGEQGAELVLVQELPRQETTPEDRARIAAAIRRRISQGHGLSVASLVLVPADGVPTTVSGKVQRKACRARFLAGEYPEPTGLTDVPAAQPAAAQPPAAQPGVATERDASEIEYRIRQIIAQAAGCDISAVSAGGPFADYGLSSLQAVEMTGRLSEWLGRPVPATIAWNHPDIRSAARWLAGERAEAGPAVAARPSDEPVAIVGMSCRYPGGVGSPDELWELVANSRDAVTGLPEDRGWDLDRLYDPDPDHPGTAYVRGGGFVDGPGDFDAGFFGISPREALAMDPQQRLLLEGAWAALENARIDPVALRGSDTGVFCGAIASDYGGPMKPELEGLRLTGITASVVSGRVAYSLGLEGPALSVDTACSSSLVAMHLAAQALRNGECSLALAGGVTVLSSPFLLVEFSRQRGLAPDGRCKSYSAEADGTGFADGLGLVVLERLSDARRNGHEVLAVLRGSAVNQDGASNGLTAPNGPSQERVIRAALASAGLNPADVDVVEGHGTGTKLGDPIEAQALLATYGQDRPEGRPLRLGSVKSNFGHTQAAAGVAGVIKMVQALRHETLPGTLHADQPSPHVDWETSGLKLLTQAEPWPDADRPRRAGVSSFGVSGTNAHIILEAAPAPEQPAEEEPRPLPAVPVLVSAKDPVALREQAGQLRDHLLARPELGLAEVGFSAATTRAQLEHRAAVVAADRGALLSGLASLAAGVPAGDVVQGLAGDGQVVFVFPGQGAQWAGMAVGLLDSSPVFAAEIAACGEALARYTDWSLEDVLRGVDGVPSVERVDVVQPVLFAVMAGLAALWRSYGVEPSAVVGHSQGEIAAAYVAGGLSLDDAARVVALRSKLIGRRLAGRGGMVSVALAADQVQKRIESYAGRVSVAAVNGPAAVVVSGDPGALDELLAGWEAEEVRAKRVPVDYASHSAQVEEIREELLGELAPVAPCSGRIPFYSATEGRFLETAELDADYWYRNLRGQVGFEPAVQALAESSMDCFIEVSPHPVLAMAVQEAGRVAVVGSLRRDEGGPERFALSLAEAYTAGVSVDWAAFYAGSGAHRVDLPTYAFQRQRYWLAPDAGTGNLAAAGLGPVEHPLLAAAVRVGDSGEWVLTGRLSLDAQPWLADHAVFGTVVVPGAALAELALAAGEQAGCPAVAELVLQAPLVLEGRAARQVQVTVAGPDDEGRRAVAVYSGPQDGADELTCHALGALAPDTDDFATPFPGTWPPPGAEPMPADGLYERLSVAGYEYGPTFQGLRAAWQDSDGTVYTEVELPDDQAEAARQFGIHPALLDAALHGGLLEDNAEAEVRLPFSWSGIQLGQAGAARVRARISPVGESAIRVELADELGQLVASVRQLDFRPVDQAQLHSIRQQPGNDALFTMEWAPVPAASGTEPARVVNLEDLEAALADGADAPDIVVATIGGQGSDGSGAAVETLALLQRWLAGEPLSEATLAVVTRRGVAVGDEAPDVAVAPAWGLVHSAQSEHPGRFLLVDLDTDTGDLDWAALAGLDEPQLAVRAGQLLAPRLVPVTVPAPAGQDAWRLGPGRNGSLQDLALVPSDGGRPLEPGEVRVGVRAAGLNFRDVLIALGRYPGEAPLGSEAAGIILEVGPGVTGLSAGDRVLGLVPDCFGPVAVADARLLVPVPGGWSFARAASVPVAFLTAYYGLTDLAGLRPGEKVLVHAAAGGIGTAAVQLARYLGAEVFATASPAKWATVQALGVPADHIASSRDLSFRDTFLAATEGQGVDVVLGAPAGAFVDASLDLLPRGGRFIEMGKADIRDPEAVGQAHPGVTYRASDLMEAGPDRLGPMFAELMTLFGQGTLTPPPVRCSDVRRGADAFRFLHEGHNTGKVVLTVPAPLDPDGTVLITGGTGGLGALFARHLAKVHGVRHLVLASRRGPDADGVGELTAELEGLGGQVTVAACDVSDRAQLAGLLTGLERPLTAVIHAAGVLDDALVGSLTPEQVERVMRPKADAALLLDELTADLDLADFVLFSSAAGLIGNPGQGNYAAANAVLDALAARRRALGRPATSLAWGLWEQATGMTDGLEQAQLGRLERMGIKPIDEELGLELFDQARARDEALLVPVRLDQAALRAQAQAGLLPPLLRGLVRVPARRAQAAGGSLVQRLAAVARPDWEGVTLELVQAQVAAVLGHASAAAIDPGRAFKELGFDSLASMELRNRLTHTTGLRLPATLVFDHPTPVAVARYLLTQVGETGDKDRSPLEEELQKVEALLAAMANDEDQLSEYESRLRSFSNRLWSILEGAKGYRGDEKTAAEAEDDLDQVSDDDVFDLIDKEIRAM